MQTHQTHRLYWLTVGCTFFLMLWGNLLSASGSGLGCPDWPLCYGTVTPPSTPEVILEWGHRLIAAATSVLILFTVIDIFRSRHERPALKRASYAIVVLLISQILLGGITVLLGLSVIASTLHLLTATTIFSGLILLAVVRTWNTPQDPNASSKLRRLCITGIVGLFVQFALGAIVRHDHAGLSCPNFPTCLDSFWPIPWTLQTAVAFFHRWWGILMIGVFVHVWKESKSASPLVRRIGAFLFTLSLVQVGLGIWTVLGGLALPIRTLHAAIGYLLWLGLFLISLRSGAFKILYHETRPIIPSTVP